VSDNKWSQFYSFSEQHTDTVFISLDISSITPAKSTLFIHYISILRFSYIFCCVSHHLQGELTCTLLNDTCFYTDTLYGAVVASQNIIVAVSWLDALNSNATKTGHGFFLRTLSLVDPITKVSQMKTLKVW